MLFSKNKLPITSSKQAQQIITAIRKTMAVIEFTPNGTILTANNAFCELMGYSPQELEHQHHRLFCSPDIYQSPRYQQAWNRLAAGESWSNRFVRINKAGEEIWLEASYIPVSDSNGSVVRIIKIATDISEQIRREQAEHSVMTAIDRSMAVIEFSLNGLIISANENFLKTMDYSIDEILGQHHAMFCSPAYTTSPEYSAFWAKLNRGEFISDRFERIDKHGKKVWLRATYNPLYDATDRLYGVIKIASNITAQVEQRHAESNAALLAMQIASQTDNSAEQGASSVTQTASMVQDIAVSLNQTAEAISDLSIQSAKISELVNSIQDIAVQTNLLALNAAIEAAHAGPQGRGFAVVADEVRGLAARTHQTTLMISDVVRQNQVSTKNAVLQMQNNQRSVEQGVTMATQAGVIMHTIQNDARKVVHAIEQVADTLGSK